MPRETCQDNPYEARRFLMSQWPVGGQPSLVAKCLLSKEMDLWGMHPFVAGECSEELCAWALGKQGLRKSLGERIHGIRPKHLRTWHGQLFAIHLWRYFNAAAAIARAMFDEFDEFDEKRGDLLDLLSDLPTRSDWTQAFEWGPYAQALVLELRAGNPGFWRAPMSSHMEFVTGRSSYNTKTGLFPRQSVAESLVLAGYDSMSRRNVFGGRDLSCGWRGSWRAEQEKLILQSHVQPKDALSASSLGTRRL